MSTPRIPAVKLDPAEMRPEDTYDAYWEMTESVCDVEIPEPQLRKKGVFANAWLLDELVIVEAKPPANTARRTARHVRRGAVDLVQLHLADVRDVMSTWLVMDDDTIELDDCAVHLTDYAREGTEFCGPNHYVSMLLPHAAVGYDPRRHPAHIRMSLDQPAAMILNNAFGALHRQLDAVAETDARGIAEGFSGLVRGLMLQGFRDTEAGYRHKAARRRAMRAFIESRLHDPALGIDSIIGAFGASRATIYRDFAPVGGLDAYIAGRRLERAFIDLASGPAYRGRVTRVAEAWGFPALSQFYKHFRQRFECTPSEVMYASPECNDSTRHAEGDAGQTGFEAAILWVAGQRPDAGTLDEGL